MKSFYLRVIALHLAACGMACSQSFTNYLRQTQMPAGVTWDASSTITPSGSQLSDLAINPGGARFDLWTIKSGTPLTEYLLATRYVSSYTPLADVNVRSQDPYTLIPRTRADRPFYVDVVVSGLLAGAADPLPSKSVTFLRHVQSYGAGGTGVGIDRTQAILFSQVSIALNGTQTLTYAVNAIPGANRAKVSGEERFSVFSLADYQAPASELSSQLIQIWPVADGTITGIAQDQLFRNALPQVTIAMNDLYPSSSTYLQVYPGNPQLGQSGTILPWSLNHSSSVPLSTTKTLADYDSFLEEDGRWTMELLTVTPFGIDRLAFVSFNLDRNMSVNGSFTTIEE